ncbi:MAG: hypothetical protein KDE27_01265, partial [Planctomycetes bacterium]|nr:hypothetical protein [Planctomycetota bacterium]
RELGAIPTKYHALLANGGAPVAAGRAAVLAALRRRLFEELRAAPEQLPPSLGERVTDWYEEAVVPGLVASAAAAPVRLVLDLVDADGLARERCVSVGRNAVEALPAPAVPAGVRPWLARFEAHERRVLELLRAPSPDHLAAALASDPTCPDSIVERAVEILVRDGSLEEHQ